MFINERILLELNELRHLYFLRFRDYLLIRDSETGFREMYPAMSNLGFSSAHQRNREDPITIPLVVL